MNTNSSYAYDMQETDRLDGVRTRRVLAFCVDYLLIALLTFMCRYCGVFHRHFHPWPWLAALSRSSPR